MVYHDWCSVCVSSFVLQIFVLVIKSIPANIKAVVLLRVPVLTPIIRRVVL